MESTNRSSLAWRILFALVLGALARWLLGPRAVALGEIATSIIQILKAMAAPLVFLAVTEACSRVRLRWIQGARLLTIGLINATVAGCIAITLDHFIPLRSMESLRVALTNGSAPADAKPAALPFGAMLEGLLPKSVVSPFLDNQVIGAVMLALFAGLALRATKDRADAMGRVQLAAIDAAVSGALRVLMTAIGWIVAIVPIAVFCVIAKVVGQSGFEPFKSLGFFLAIVCAGFFLHGGVYYSALLRIAGNIRPRSFFALAAEPMATAMGTGSSLATLPVTLRTLQERMNVRPENARLAAMVGTNLNHDGILLYEAAVALFVARVMGIPLDAAQQLLVVGISAIAAFGIGGIPDAGLITLSLVLSTLKLPLAAVPLLLPLDWLIGRMRATLNVTSDMVVANLLEAWDRKRPAGAVQIEPAE